jgi:MFS family permease
MLIEIQIQKLVDVYHEYPRAFWMVVIVNFIDRLGTSLLLPFFALYMTRRFNVGMETAGALFAIWTISSFIGSFPGGALTDRLGRKGMIMLGLVATSLSHLALGLVDTVTLFFIFGSIAGIFTDIASPAYQAVVADLLPEQKRSQGYGIVRVATNLSAALGPAIGGFIALHSYLVLFGIGAAISLAAAVVVFFILPETKPQPRPSAVRETTAASFGGYLRILHDGPFMAFTAISSVAWLVYINLTTSLGVFLRNAHGIPETGYGWLLSLNAALVVLFQFPITRRIEKHPPMALMSIGAALLGIGFAMVGFFSAYAFFLAAVLVLTLGEMIMLPVSNALVVKFAPEDMRGRYSFMFGISWGIAYAAGPYLAGLIMDNTNPNWLWYACGILGMAAAVGFFFLQGWSRRPLLISIQKP